MPKTLQIRDVPEDQYRILAERAARAGTTVPELLRREIERITEHPPMDEWLDRTRSRQTTMSTEEVLDALDEVRGPWPDDDR